MAALLAGQVPSKGGGVLVLLSAASLLLAQDRPPQKPNRDDFEQKIRELIGPADPKKAEDEARELAEEFMPSAEQLRKNGDWKLPWEFPARWRPLIPTPKMQTQDNARLGVARDLYWQNLGKNAAFVGLTEEQGKKALKEMQEELGKVAAQDGVSERQVLLTLLMMPWSAWHPSNPTLAVAADRESLIAARAAEFAATLKDRRPTDKEGNRFMLDVLASLYSKVKDEELKDEVVRAFTLNQKRTRLVFFRSNKWEKILQLDKANTPYDVRQMVEEQIRYSVALINFRTVSPDSLKYVQDLTAEEAKRLQERSAELHKVQVKIEQPEIERRLKNLDENIETAKFQRVEENVKSLLKSKRELEDAWAVRKEGFPRVQLLKYGESSYMFSQRYAQEWGEIGTHHTASLRNGTAFAEIEILSTFPEEESLKDLEFFLKVMHTNTLHLRLAQ